MATNKLVSYFNKSFVSTDVFVRTTKKNETVDNPFEYHPSKTSVYPIWPERYIDSSPKSGTLACGNKVKWQSPTNGVMKILWHRFTLAQTTTASYSDYVGGHVIKSFKVTQGTQTILDVQNYTLWREYLFKFLNYEVVTRILAIEGGSSITSTGGTISVAAWIPLPWDYFCASEQGGFDFALIDKDNPITFEITYNAASDIITPTGTGAAISSGDLCYHMINTSNLSEIQNTLKKSEGFYIPAILPDMPGSTGATLATATTTSYSLNDLTKFYKEIAIFSRLSSDITAKKWSGPLQLIDTLTHTFDTNEETYFDSKVESNMINLEETSEKAYPIQFTNYPVILSYSQWDQHAKPTDVTGYVSSSVARTWSIKLSHTVGANCQLDFIGIYHGIITVKFDKNGRGSMATITGGNL